jgi:amidase
VALGLSMVALGSETDGSIGKPSQRSSLVGMKPTVGLTSRYLVIPLSAHQDSVGPMAKTVKDAAYLLSAIVGYDKNSAQIPWTVKPDYVGACVPGGLKVIRIFVFITYAILAKFMCFT